MTPIPFDPVHSRDLMILLGYECIAHSAHWEDVGGPESGPRLEGHDAYDEWQRGDHSVIVQDGMVVDAFLAQPNPPGWEDQPDPTDVEEMRVDGYNVEFLGAKPARNGEDY